MADDSKYRVGSYIFDLLKRATRVSLEIMKIGNSLPALNEKK
jgi:hypothetical protein